MAPKTALDLLLVTPVESDSQELASILAHSRWALDWVRTGREGLEFLRRSSYVAVVCDQDLPDGCWRDLASALRTAPDPPLLFVGCSNPRGLWFDVVHAGGFDVVLKPFERGEVTWALTVAWSQWSNRARTKSNGHLHAGF
jgi:DNA-binding response OmpR family regulator